ncbi:response regulator receiver protein [Kineococcus radiotolerans SRS30216 = ATCC BAA-149]|uniref:Response regulator receiver protein n=1 Tax=Kineococcus radiotolerans (strain ATCC BAA-149 / DSM 14245 / SRS30216) TaxID=266940 RepID=A6W4S6_KINRD|nr:response regulator [Kineococcus radiotolerans]ABS01815.1 response regulator receiver protein [Kineococcus radiotolerans SRS30216 = ATCC BAA-149]
MKALVVDDSRVMRQIVIRTLRQAGFDWVDVVQAENGKEGFDAVRKENPDIVLSDWNMPEASGYEMLQNLRGSGLDVPFGFVTSEGSEEMREKAAAAGALFLIAKPFTPEQFAAALAPVLGGDAGPATATTAVAQGEVKFEVNPLPSNLAIRNLLSDLLNRDVELADGRPVPVGGKPGSLVGLYVDDHLKSKAVVVFDFALAAHAGASIGLLPPGASEAAIEDRELPENLTVNAKEVLNIMASLFNVEGAAHLKLYASYAPGEALRPDVADWATRTGSRLDLTVEVTRYGKGALSIVTF